MTGLAVRSFAVVLVLAASSALYAETRHYGLIGFDTYPLIASSSVDSMRDVAGLVSERLMDGRYPSRFHRPVTSASFALDHALWGLDATGYQRTNVLCFAAILLGLHAIGWQLGGRRPSILAIAVPACFALHPAFYEIVPIPARRADLLCCAFGVAAVAAALAGRIRGAAVATLLAIASKESGFGIVPLAIAAALLSQRAEAGRVPDRERLRARLLRAWPIAAAAAFMLAVRLGVLGGVGGHRELSLLEVLAAVPRTALGLILGLAVPDWGRPRRIDALILCASLACALAAVARRPWREHARERVALILGLAWIVVLAATYAVGGWVGAWYYMIPAVGWAIAVAALLQWMIALALAQGSRRRSSEALGPQQAAGAGGFVRVLAGAALVGLLVSVARQGSLTPFFHRYGEWANATAVSDEFLRDLDARIAAAPDGSRIDGPPLPMWAPAREGIPSVKGAAILSDYSVQAWADLVHPERRIRVLGVELGVLPIGPGEAAPDELVVALPRRQVGY